MLHEECLPPEPHPLPGLWSMLICKQAKGVICEQIYVTECRVCCDTLCANHDHHHHHHNIVSVEYVSLALLY